MTRRLAVVASLLALAGCLQEVVEDNPGSGTRPLNDEEAALAARYDIHALLEDDEIEGGGDVSAARVQAFLVFKGSALADYEDDGESAAALIVARSRAADIHPLYLLARIQTESSLISSGTLRHIDRATGCGCPDGGSCSGAYAGLGDQVQCAAEKVREYLADLDEGGETVAGWSVDEAKRTLDPCTATPRNRATAALYTYTPWVGAYGQQCRKAGVGGSTLLVNIYRRYQAEFGALVVEEEEPAVDAGVDPDGGEVAAGGGDAGAGPADAGVGDGDAGQTGAAFCEGRHGTWCDGDALVDCGAGGGVEVGREACAQGCASMPLGTPDRCNE